MNHPNQEKSFTAKYGWIIGIILLIATIILHVVLWKVIPVFVDLYQDFGVEISAIESYQKVVSVIMVLAELLLSPIIVFLFLIDNSKFHQFVKWFFIAYAITLPIILIGAIYMIYSNVFVMGAVVS